jgi:ABC-type Mn2+/Zn2+ transport system ATPase subunit
MLINVEQAVFGYGGRAVVSVQRFAVEAGRAIGIFGPNGAGKTTLVRGVTGLLPPMSGAVRQNADPQTPPGSSPGGVLAYASAPIRFAYMPQQRSMELHWPMSGLDAAALATSARNRFGWLGRDSTANLLAHMRQLDVEELATRSFSRLSGGQQQRILLAGAMASDPHVLVLDEPTDGLDVRSTQHLLDLLRTFTSNGLAIVIISHEVEDLLYLCDQIAWLHPAEQAEEPSRVEIISPAALADRVTRFRRKV